MPSIHSGSPGPDCVQATLVKARTSEHGLEWIRLCCGFSIGVTERQNKSRFVYTPLLGHPSVPTNLTLASLFHKGYISHFFYFLFSLPPFPSLSISVSLSWTDSYVGKAASNLLFSLGCLELAILLPSPSEC